MVIPTRRNGSETSQTIGNKTSASTARGQQSTNRMHQPIKKIRAFMLVLMFHFGYQRQPLFGGFRKAGIVAADVRRLIFKRPEIRAS